MVDRETIAKKYTKQKSNLDNKYKCNDYSLFFHTNKNQFNSYESIGEAFKVQRKEYKEKLTEIENSFKEEIKPYLGLDRFSTDTDVQNELLDELFAFTKTSENNNFLNIWLKMDDLSDWLSIGMDILKTS
jgi:hypothetical protein